MNIRLHPLKFINQINEFRTAIFSRVLLNTQFVIALSGPIKNKLNYTSR